jgi:O-antigen/teichoic acid export membrane protein
MYLSRLMGANSFGFYFFIVTLITTLVIFSKNGLDLLVIRFIPKYIVENKYNELNGIARYVNNRSIRNCIFVVTIYISIIFLLNQYILIKDISLYFIGILLLPILTLLQLNQAKLNGFKEIILSQLPERIILPLSIIIFVYFYTIISGTQLNVANMLYIHILILFIVYLISNFWLNRKISQYSFTEKPIYLHKKWGGISKNLIVITAGHMIFTNIDVLMIGTILDKENSGIYGIASRISIFIAFGLFAINTVIAPQISKLYSENNINSLKSLLFKSSKYNLIFTSLLFILIVYFNYEILNLFGIEFLRGSTVLIILCVAQLINVITGSVGVLMTMTGLESYTAKIIIFSIVLNIILNLILIPRYAIEGAAIATAFTISISNILMLYFSIRETGINASPLRLSK